MTTPPVPPIPDLDRYQLYASLGQDTSSQTVNFAIFGSQEDLTVLVNGAALSSANWSLTSASGTPIAQLPLPITDGIINFFPVVPSGSKLEIIGNFQPRQLTMPTAPGIARREFNQTVGSIMSTLRELKRQLGNTTAPLSMAFNASGTLANRATYNTAAQGFVYLQTDDSQGRPVFYVKNSATSGDWSQALIVQSPAASTVAQVPIGAVLPFTGQVAPANYVFPYGQTFSRATFAGLLAACSTTQTGTFTSGSSTVTGLATTDGLGIGMPFESASVPAGTTIATIASSTSVTLSANATATGAASATIFLYGNGDGSTTFTGPDMRGKSIFGRDNMGGTAAGLITTGGSGIAGTFVNAKGGQEVHALTIAELANHSHTANVSDPGHAHTTSVPQSASIYGAGAGPAANNGVSSNVASSLSGTGISVTNVSTGSGTAHQNMPPAIVMNCIMRVQ